MPVDPEGRRPARDENCGSGKNDDPEATLYKSSGPEGSVADVSRTDVAPTFAAPAWAESSRSAKPRPEPAGEIEVFPPGSCIDDFDVIRVLGRGAFGVVYLALQRSLNRKVALKISPNQGEEGRTMAQLEHESIVQVFSESLSSDGRQRLLCMQYIPGTTLEAVIRSMHRGYSRPWGGNSILQLIDELNPEPPPFHPAAMRERQELSDADSIEAVCWIGARLAEALAYAHNKGVLHRDIKPANILQTRYGRPMLADFNLAFRPVDWHAGRSALFGGTLAYMSPEHLEAFHPAGTRDQDRVDQRSDVYSLGVVLYELAGGDVGLPPFPGGLNAIEKLEFITAARRRPPPCLEKSGSPSSRVFDLTIRKCLAADPEQRYQDASRLAVCLTGCQTLSQVEKELPTPGPITRSALRHPFFWLVLLAILPHLPVGSTVNIAYNALRIVGDLSAEQKATFNQLIVLYNGVFYPICMLLFAYVLRPVWSAWKTLHDCPELADREAIDAARRGTTRWPVWLVILASLGWFPAGIFFPLGLHLLSGPVPAWVFVHFIISCTLSGLIAMTYSFFAIQYLTTRVLYPNLWSEVEDLRRVASGELQGVRPFLSFFQMLAGLVPLVGAMLVVGLGPESPENYGVFRFLVMTLMVLGFCGFQLANNSSRLINQTIQALTRVRRAASVAER